MLFAGNKTFYFDVGSNRYGVFLRISELRSNYRTAVTIPENHWHRFRDILTELSNELEQTKMVDEKEGQALKKAQPQGESGDDKDSVAIEDKRPQEKKEVSTEEKAMAGQVDNTASSSTAPIKAEPTAIPVAWGDSLLLSKLAANAAHFIFTSFFIYLFTLLSYASSVIFTNNSSACIY